jgi:hypothetical protein
MGGLRNKPPDLDLSEQHRWLSCMGPKLVQGSGCWLSELAGTCDAIGGGGFEPVA